jgi:hypothetical protein
MTIDVRDVKLSKINIPLINLIILSHTYFTCIEDDDDAFDISGPTNYDLHLDSTRE